MRPRLPMIVRAAGFTLFELIVVVVVVALLAGILLGRFSTYQELAEKAAMEQTAGTIRSALAIQVAGMIARGRAEDIPKLAAVNPISWLTENQKNYAGEYFEPAPDDVPPGSWYYDLKRKQLVYLVQRGDHFAPRQDGGKWVRYQVILVYNEGILTRTSGSGEKELGGVVLTEVEPYQWEVR